MKKSYILLIKTKIPVYHITDPAQQEVLFQTDQIAPVYIPCHILCKGTPYINHCITS